MTDSGAVVGPSKGKRKQFLSGKDGKSKKRFKGAAIDVTKGIRAILCTCDQGKEEASARELIAWLDEAAEKHFPQSQPLLDDADESGDEDDSEPVSIAAALQAELAALKGKSQQPVANGGERFRAVNSGIRGVSMVHVRDKAFDHGELVRRMVADLQSPQGRMQTRYSIRLQVVHRTCFARLEELLALAKPIIAEHFVDTTNAGSTYAVIINKRTQNDEMSSDAIIKALAAMVPRNYRVDLNRPSTVIMVQINARMAGVGVMKGFTALQKYHIRAIGEQRKQIDPAAANEAVVDGGD